ncbi:MAG: two-component regulator propeller domain-containing protein [Bacteroidota bacterium]
MYPSLIFDVYKKAKKQWSIILLLTSLLLISRAPAQNLIPPIGQWREHLNYQQAIQVVNGDKLYCATTTNLFSVDPNKEIERYSKVSGLNDVGVQCIGWDATTQQLVVAYTNSNVDVIKNSNTKNISDIKRSTISGNKTIYSVYCKDGLAYLSSGLGVIVVNLSKYEIKNTWFIGNNGAQVKVSALTNDGTFIYAATEEGLKSISINANNLSNYANWQLLSGANGLSTGPVRNIQFTNNKVIAEKNDSLFILNGNTWSLLYSDKTWPIVNITSSENKLSVCQRMANGNSRVIILTSAGQIDKTIVQSGVISFPRSAITENNTVWVADQFGGLSRSGASVERFIPNGPPGTADGEIVIQNNILYAAAGSVNSAWNYQYNRNGLYYFQQDEWSYKGANTLPVLDSVLDMITVAIDPTNASVWAGSYGGGLINLKDDAQPRIYKKTNSTLQAAIGDPASCRVSGLAFDQNKNLWVSNYGAAQNLHVRKADSSWKAFTIPFTHLENAVSQILVDDINQLWMVSPKDNGVFCYNYGTSVDNTADDKWKFYKQGTGNGNLPSNNVLCLLKDRDGFIWVGTDKGIGIIQCIGDVFSSQSCDAILPIVQLDRFAGLLFKDEVVQCMAVDGANRKWIGTKNGVWLISPDGSKIIYRFTAENSPLLNNDVKRIAIDPTTGEVFISTLSGICSFRSTATEGGVSNSNVLVFPNPVPPGYNGTIAIRGLVDNALVKIAELNGRLVFQTRALGGQAIWDGRNYNGQKVASGIYLVIIRDDSGVEKLATKIVITSGR